MSDNKFMECMAREALKRYPTKEHRASYYQKLIKKKTRSIGKEKAIEFVEKLKDLMRIEWHKQNPGYRARAIEK